MIDSVRHRLALWHTAALAVVLAAFSAGAYAYLVRTTQRQIDRSLAETARAFGAAWAAEQVEGNDSPGGRAESVREAMSAFRYRERQVLVYDETGSLLARSDTVQLSPDLTPDAVASTHAGALASLVAAAREAPAYATIGDGDARVRGYAMQSRRPTARYTVVVLRVMHDEEEAGETFLQWLLTAVPIAIALSGVGGYLLASASLAPVVAMGEQAERISATTLDARVAIANPRDELGRLGGVLNRLLARLERSFQQQRTFMADASHELRTPVAVVRSAADVALDRPDRPADELRQSLEVIRGEGRRLTRIVDDLFLLARADAGQQPVRREMVYLEEIVADVARAGRILAAARGVTVDAPPCDEAPFCGDAALLGRLLLNLVDNAVKHTPAGGQVRIELRRDESVRPSRMGESPPPPITTSYRISVEDPGTGVHEAVRARIFERFVRGDAARGRAVESATSGAGLGLAIARWIAEAHDGRIVLERTSTEGSSFVVTLPASPSLPC